jgi:hypothetical protein
MVTVIATVMAAAMKVLVVRRTAADRRRDRHQRGEREGCDRTVTDDLRDSGGIAAGSSTKKCS